MSNEPKLFIRTFLDNIKLNALSIYTYCGVVFMVFMLYKWT